MRFSRLIRFSAMLLISAVLTNNVAFAAKKPADPATLKARIQARGVGQGVRVTLADSAEAKGMIVSVGELSFALKSKHDAQPREIEYSQLTGVYKDKLTRGQKIGITVAVVSIAIAITAVVFTIELDKPIGPIFVPLAISK
jgi:hypothetical protein